MRSVDIQDGVSHLGSPKSYIVAGSNAFDEGGDIRLYDVTDPANPVLVTTLDVGAAVYCVELTTAAATGKLTVLVGLASKSKTWLDDSAGSLLRFDINMGASLLAFGEPTGVWGDFPNPYVDVTAHPTLWTIVRDIVVNESGSTVRAYVAGFSRGVFALDVPSSGGLTEDTATGWPITNIDGFSNVGRATGLVLHPSLGLLAVSWGPTLRTENLYWGECSVPTAADGSEALLIDPATEQFFKLGSDEPVWGVSLASVSPPAVLTKIQANHSNPNGIGTLPGAAVGLSLRTGTSTLFYLDVACDHLGMNVVRAAGSGSNWSLRRQGDWDKDDGVPTSSMDDVLVQNEVLYAANEITVQAFDTTDTLPLASGDIVENAGGVLLSGFADSPARLYASGPDGGIVFLDVEGPTKKLDPVAHPFYLLATDGQAYTPYAFLFEHGPAGPERWLAAVNSKSFEYDPDRPFQKNGSLKIYYVGNEVSPGAPGSVDQLLGTFKVDPTNPISPAAGTLMGIHMQWVSVENQIHTFAIYLSYGAANQEHYAGIMVLSAEYDEGSEVMTFEFVAKFPFDPIFIDPPEAGYADAQIGRLTWDAEHDRLYAALGCKGILWLDFDSDPFVPSGGGSYQHGFDSSYPELAHATALQVVPGPFPYVLVSMLEHGIAIVRADESFPQMVALHRTRFQATALFPVAPTTDVFWVADGRGGVHRMQFEDSIFDP